MIRDVTISRVVSKKKMLAGPSLKRSTLVKLRLYYSEFDWNWLELGCIFEVPWDDIYCDLVLFK